jgi:hypothetical protein
VGPLSSRHGASSGCGWKGWIWTNDYIRSEGLVGEGVHCAGLLEGTGVELPEWRSSPAAATPTTYLRLKMRQKEDETNWAVKHNPCYWISSKPRVTSDFSKLQQTPKSTDNQRIADTHMCISVHIFVYSFRRCYTQFCAYPNYMHIKIFVKTTYKCLSIKQQHR